ncbi:methyltransferase domain-containing protein [Legionella sp. D16C41]|uniref:class I SAM-dependent methyltransferase n=1 Tax=Legionella sp. D16C41 TaxID=3402688 RepID=UPI003AF72281
MKSLLTQAGYILHSDTQVWSFPDYNSIDYSDGDEVEQRLATVIAQAKDITVLSNELRQYQQDWPSIYHLSSSRANILRPFKDLLLNADVLEIGAGCGAITRYLGECGANVLALEGTLRRAAIARSRTRDLPNVEVVTNKFDQFGWCQKFDIITLIGVLEYATIFMPGENPALAMLQQALGMLKPNGKLIIAIENQLGLKYFAAAPEDHIGKSMYGIESQYRKGEVQTYGYSTLKRLLQQAGFAGSDFFAPFPDYKLPISIVSEAGFNCSSFNSVDLISGTVRHDLQLPFFLAFSPELAWHTIIQNDLALDMTNSFLILAHNTEKKVFRPDILAYHYSTQRVSQFCKETIFVKNETDIIELHYNLLKNSSSKALHKGKLIQFTLSPRADYVNGTLLARELIKIVTRDGWNINQVGTFLHRYWSILVTLITEGNCNIAKSKLTFSLDTLLPGECFDLSPQNIVIDKDGKPHAIDKEWTWNEPIALGFVLFRCLLMLIHSVSRFGITNPVLPTYKSFILAAYEAAGFKISNDDIKDYWEIENAVQSEIVGDLIKRSDINWLSSPLRVFNLHQILLEKNSNILNLNEVFVEQDNNIAKLKQISMGQDNNITNLKQALLESNDVIANLNQTLLERDNDIVNLNQTISLLNEEINALKFSVRQYAQSRSWRLTKPIRLLMQKIKGS